MICCSLPSIIPVHECCTTAEPIIFLSLLSDQNVLCSTCASNRQQRAPHFSSFFKTQRSPGITLYQILTKQLECSFLLLRPSVIAEVLPLTLTTWFSSVPLGSLAVAHDTRQCRVTLQQVASLAMKCHHRSQLVVSTHSSAIHHIPGIKTRLPQFSCQSKKTKLLQQ